MTNARIRRQVDKDPVEGALITNTGPAGAISARQGVTVRYCRVN